MSAINVPPKDLKIEPSAIVDVSISDLPLYEVAEFFNRVHTRTIIAPGCTVEIRRRQPIAGPYHNGQCSERHRIVRHA